MQRSLWLAGLLFATLCLANAAWASPEHSAPPIAPSAAVAIASATGESISVVASSDEATAEAAAKTKTDAKPAEATPAKEESEKELSAKEERPEDKNVDKPSAPAASADSKPHDKPAAAKAHEATAEKKNAAKSETKTAEAKKTEAKKTEAKKTQVKKDETKKPEKAAPAQIARFVITGDLREGPPPVDIFAGSQASLSDVITRLDEAAKDKSIAGVWLRIESPEIGRARIYELRAAVQRIRAAGKPVFAEIASAETGQYLLASSCDQVIMPPSGVLLVPGVRAEMLFLKGLLDKIGVQFDSLQMGKYKGAAEPLTRDSMSAPLRESLEALVDDAYGDIVNTLAKDRGMQDYRVKTLIDDAMFTAPAARQAGLVDQVLYADQVEEAFRKRLKVDAVQLVTNFRQKKVDTDFSGIGGFMKFVDLMMGGKKSAETAARKRKVAVVYAVGAIMEGKSGDGVFGESSVGSTTIIKALQDAAEDKEVVGIVLRIDSPGGSAVASDLIWRQVVQMKKPIIASMGDVAGSGGYYIAMGADKILAAPGTITGSIGVIGGKPVFHDLYEKLGIHPEVIARGSKSGSYSVNTPFSAEEREAMTKLMRDIYRQFVNKAAQGRKMSRQKMEELAQGRVYSGQRAVELGLVDRLGTLQDAIDEVKLAGGLKAEEEVEILVLPRPRSFFEQLFDDGSISGDVESSLTQSVTKGVPELAAALRQARLWQTMLQREPVVLALPCQLKLK